MKRALAIALVGTVCISALAQGTFLLDNYGGGANAPVFDTDGITGLGNTFEADLYWAPGTVTDSSSLTALREPTTFISSGYFRGGSRFISANTGGQILTAQVRVWDIASGTSWEQASTVPNAKVGESALFPLYLIIGLPPPNSLYNMQSFSVHTVVPEPSTLTLASLGLAAAMVLTRRRHQRHRLTNPTSARSELRDDKRIIY